MKNVTFVAAVLAHGFAPVSTGPEYIHHCVDQAIRLIEACGDDPEATLSINIYDPRGVLAGEEPSE